MLQKRETVHLDRVRPDRGAAWRCVIWMAQGSSGIFRESLVRPRESEGVANLMELIIDTITDEIRRCLELVRAYKKDSDEEKLLLKKIQALRAIRKRVERIIQTM